ncbi:MAG: hypothetical protein WA584_12320 [Pyrinomonadaceae bacterium]
MNSGKPNSNNKTRINRSRNDFRRPEAMKARKNIWINALFKTLITLAILIFLGIVILPFGLFVLILIYSQHIYFVEVIGAKFSHNCGGGGGWIPICSQTNYAVFAWTTVFDLLILYFIIFFILLIKEKYKNS